MRSRTTTISSTSRSRSDPTASVRSPRHGRRDGVESGIEGMLPAGSRPVGKRTWQAHQEICQWKVSRVGLSSRTRGRFPARKLAPEPRPPNEARPNRAHPAIKPRARTNERSDPFSGVRWLFVRRRVLRVLFLPRQQIQLALALAAGRIDTRTTCPTRRFALLPRPPPVGIARGLVPC